MTQQTAVPCSRRCRTSSHISVTKLPQNSLKLPRLAAQFTGLWSISLSKSTGLSFSPVCIVMWRSDLIFQWCTFTLKQSRLTPESILLPVQLTAVYLSSFDVPSKILSLLKSQYVTHLDTLSSLYFRLFCILFQKTCWVFSPTRQTYYCKGR